MNGKYETVDTVTTERGARTMTVDPKNHRVYLLAAEYGPAPEARPERKAVRRSFRTASTSWWLVNSWHGGRRRILRT